LYTVQNNQFYDYYITDVPPYLYYFSLYHNIYITYYIGIYQVPFSDDNVDFFLLESADLPKLEEFKDFFFGFEKKNITMIFYITFKTPFLKKKKWCRF
jgi:hypothetical protein